jgi:hypothetical protein
MKKETTSVGDTTSGLGGLQRAACQMHVSVIAFICAFIVGSRRRSPSCALSSFTHTRRTSPVHH